MTNSQYVNSQSLNSVSVTHYYGRLDRIDRTLKFSVAYQYAYTDNEGNIDTTFRYNSYENYESFIKSQQNEKKPENMRWYEIIKADNPVIECYDLDAKLNDKNDRNITMFEQYQKIGEDAMIDEFKHYRKQFIENYYPTYDADKEYFAISSACNNNKFSLHIAVRNGFCFQDTSKLKIMMKKFDEYLKDKKFCLDLSIYSKNRCMRMLGNTKYNQKRFLKRHRYSSGLDEKDFLFSYVKSEDKIFEIKEPIESKPSFIKNEEKTKICDTTKDYEKMTQLLDIINSDCSQSKWSTVGQVIFNQTNGSDDGLEQFIKWSQKDYDEFNENSCIQTWNSYKENSSYGMGVLVNRAKEDSPEEYSKLVKKNDNFYQDIVFIDDEIVFNDKIDIKKEDNYYWVDFERKYMNTVFRDYEDLKQNIIQDLPRVLVKITIGKGFYIKKEHTDALCDLIPIKDMKRIVFRYNSTFRNKKGQDVIDILNVKLDDIYTDCKLPLYSHPDMVLDKNIKSNAYNIFKGIKANKVENINMNLINKFFTHIETIICNDNKEASHFFISWMRWIMIHPHIKTKIFIFLFSEEGYGKSTIGNFLSHYIFGDTASHISSGLDSLTGSFNRHLLGKLFCQVEELPSTSENFHKQFDNMKTLITENKMFCNPKGIDGFKMNNFLNFMGCSNNKYSLRMPKTDTRYFVQEITKKMNSEYWNDYYKNFQNQEFADMLYSFFLKTSDDDFVKFNGRPKIPMTDLKQELIDFSLPTHEKFYKDVMDGEYKLNSCILKPEFTYKGETYKYATTLQELWCEYLNWGLLMGERDLKRKYLEFKLLRNEKFRFIDLREKIKNIDTFSFKTNER